MMTDPCYPNGPQNVPPIYGASQQVMNPNSSSSPSTNQTSFLYNLSLLKDKVHEMQSLASIFSHHPESPIVASTMGTLIQEIIVTASSMMFACQQMSLAAAPSPATTFDVDNKTTAATETLFVNPHGDDTWYGDVAMGRNGDYTTIELPVKTEGEAAEGERSYELIEVEAADLLAKYTHYCKVCGKGFKRDANLRMHMRAHGDEYKSSAALSNPAKNKGEETGTGTGTGTRKYSCPQEGCRWNKRHARFQPLKSMICVKNHYKRTHCPKMYVCKRCNAKHFSVLSDLRTHEKHCGDLKWLCSCGTTFSRKDKLIGHVSLFLGHTPVTALT